MCFYVGHPIGFSQEVKPEKTPLPDPPTHPSAPEQTPEPHPPTHLAAAASWVSKHGPPQAPPTQAGCTNGPSPWSEISSFSVDRCKWNGLKCSWFLLSLQAIKWACGHENAAPWDCLTCLVPRPHRIHKPRFPTHPPTPQPANKPRFRTHPPTSKQRNQGFT